MIKKSSIKGSVIAAIAGVIILLVFVTGYMVFDANAKWSDDNTWVVEDGFTSPETEDGRFKVQRDQNQVILTTDYCTLFQVSPIVTKVKSDPEEFDTTGASFHCSFMPPETFVALFSSDGYRSTVGGKEVSSDISWKITNTTDPAPDEYILPVLSKYTYSSRITAPVSVSVRLTYKLKRPEKTIPAVAIHYFDILRGKKGIIGVEITSWFTKKLTQ